MEVKSGINKDASSTKVSKLDATFETLKRIGIKQPRPYLPAQS